MIVLHPNAEQYNALNGYKYKSSELVFIKDGSGRYIVGLDVLTYSHFAEIHEQLEQLERIEYTPFPPEEYEISN